MKKPFVYSGCIIIVVGIVVMLIGDVLASNDFNDAMDARARGNQAWMDNNMDAYIDANEDEIQAYRSQSTDYLVRGFGIILAFLGVAIGFMGLAAEPPSAVPHYPYSPQEPQQQPPQQPPPQYPSQ